MSEIFQIYVRLVFCNFQFMFSKEQLNKCQITNDAFKNISVAKRLLVYYLKFFIYCFSSILSDTALNALLGKIIFFANLFQILSHILIKIDQKN